MCIRCTGGYTASGRYIEGDGDVQRHTPPPIPGVNFGPRGPRRPPPAPVRHGHLRGVRWHRGLRWDHPEKDLCDACSAFASSPAYDRAFRQDALDRALRRLDPEEGSQDPAYREFLERRVAKLTAQLAGKDEDPVRRQIDEPSQHVSIRIPVRIVDALKERAEEERTSVSDLARRALDAFLVL